MIFVLFTNKLHLLLYKKLKLILKIKASIMEKNNYYLHVLQKIIHRYCFT